MTGTIAVPRELLERIYDEPVMVHIKLAIHELLSTQPKPLPKNAGWLQGWPMVPCYTAEQMREYAGQTQA